jgi:hypothetical protein
MGLQNENPQNLREESNTIHPSTQLSEITLLAICLSMALQSFVGPWPLFQFLNLYTAGRTPWTGDQPVARPLPTHRTT